jgi:CheY-like chemotaxis protein
VGEFASQLLSELGYTTRYAANSSDAIAILEKDHAGIDGVELGRRIRASWPRISIVLTSVYSHVLAADAQHGFNLLHKPYSLAELSRALRSVRRTNDNAMVVTTQRATG